MRRPLLLRFGFWLADLHCFDCRRIIWPWQDRCRYSHSTCHHAAMRAFHERTRDMIAGYDHPMWACAFCGKVPE